ncbi:MAG: HutD family protein [Bdellovibrionales bacterium]|nr:HutD family protein [Bdellovibrionales bacterium]
MSTTKIISKSEYKRATWKNGLGFTDEIAIYPEGASLAKGDFQWRLSSARIENASPFSMFPAHDRVLVVLKGAGIRMAHAYEEGEPEDVNEVRLLEPYEFPGDIKSRCELLGGPITDFSVFAETGRIGASVSVQELSPDEEFVWMAEGRWNFAFAIEYTTDTEAGPLPEGDTLSCGAGELRFTAGAGGAKVLLISLDFHG